MPLPPPPAFDKPYSFAWLEWFRQLRNYVAQTGSVPWNVVDKAGSNLTDIAIRNHNNLQNIQGGVTGNYNHLRTYLTSTLSAYNFASISAQTTSTTTVTVTGATTSDFVILNLSSAPENSMIYDAYVSSSNTVTIRATNISSGAIDPGSRDYTVLVIR